MPAYTLKGKRIWVAGHRGMVGSAIVRRLASEDCEIVATDERAVDLKNQARTAAWVQALRPAAVFLAAAKVGGILANATYPADFLYDNLMIEANVIEASHRADVEKLLFLGSSCVYPKFAEQPIREEALLPGALEPTNEWYAIAKIAGIKLAQAYRQQHRRDLSARCRRTSTARAIISICLPVTCCRRSSAKPMRQSRRASASRRLGHWGSETRIAARR